MLSFSLRVSDYIFKCSSEVPGLLSLKFATNGRIVVIVSNITLKLKTRHLQTIYDDVTTVPERLQIDKELNFPSLSFEIWYLEAFLFGDLLYNIEY